MPLEPRLRVRAVSKRFAGVTALSNVQLELAAGEVVALVGENGAGKSTLTKILAGIHRPDTGEILLDGQVLHLASPRHAMESGIALIHQELNLADNLDVAGNLFLGREPRRLGWIDESEVGRRSQLLLEKIGANFSARTPLRNLSIGERQMVEIAKALSLEARLLLMDEPTSSLSTTEVERLFRMVRTLSAAGVSILYISHRLAEVRALASRVVVLRDGCNSGELRGSEIEHDAIVRLMVGRDLAGPIARATPKQGPRLLELEQIVVPAHPNEEQTFCVHAGEIVGLAGLVGAGRSELLEVLFGIVAPLRGRLRVAGEDLVRHSPRERIGAGIALVPEDRKLQGLFLGMSVRTNVAAASVARQARAGLVDLSAEVQLAADAMQRLRIKARSTETDVATLSGGNQQKVILGRWLARAPRVFLLDEPTRGIDVSARAEVHALVRDLAANGAAVLFASSEMEELFLLADRVLVLREGRLQGELLQHELSEESVMRLATGREHRAVSA